MNSETSEVRGQVERFQREFHALLDEMSKAIVGYREVLELIATAMFARGHVLLEGVPGLGKTMMVKTLADAIHTRFSRIQFTPDLMPADIVGTTMVVQTETGDKQFRFERGPVFCNVLLADEINRATPKTQSALLEAMQEHAVTVGDRTYKLEDPFFVLGTQNPIEMEGTYPLPEAQVDRFLFKVTVDYLDEDSLVEVVDRTTSTRSAAVQTVVTGERINEMVAIVRGVPIADHVKRYAVRLVRATHPGAEVAPGTVTQFVKYGSSPRGIQAMILGAKVRALADGRFHVACEDIAAMALPALRHRLILNFEGEAEDIRTDTVVQAILKAVPEIMEDSSGVGAAESVAGDG